MGSDPVLLTAYAGGAMTIAGAWGRTVLPPGDWRKAATGPDGALRYELGEPGVRQGRRRGEAMDPRPRERTAALAAREASPARPEQVVAAREQELRAGWAPRPLRGALRFAPLTAIELVVAATILVAALALTGAWPMTVAAVGAAAIAVTCVARLIAVQRPR